MREGGVVITASPAEHPHQSSTTNCPLMTLLLLSRAVIDTPIAHISLPRALWMWMWMWMYVLGCE